MLQYYNWFRFFFFEIELVAEISRLAEHQNDDTLYEIIEHSIQMWTNPSCANQDRFAIDIWKDQRL